MSYHDLEAITPHEHASLYFIGIGGAGMYPLACLAADMGFRVRGCDREESKNTVRLKKRGIFVDSEREACLDGASLAIYTLAVSMSDPVVQKALLFGIPLVPRAAFLGVLMMQFPLRAAVAGSHGKSSTVGMCASILKAAGKKPTVLCGADLFEDTGGYEKGDGEIILLEACEYRDAFLSLHPTHALVLNGEWEHPDYFQDDMAVKSSFQRFLNLPDVKIALAPNGFSDTALPISQMVEKREEGCKDGNSFFTLMRRGRRVGKVSLRVAGTFQSENALAAAALCYSLGASDRAILQGLNAYRGIGRRMEHCGFLKGCPVYLDYAHHPTELSAALQTAEKTWKRVVLVFEPHTYSRTAAFFDRFASLLHRHDPVGILPVYGAREAYREEASGKALSTAAGAVYLQDHQAVISFLSAHAKEGSVLLLVGAGHIDQVITLLRGQAVLVDGGEGEGCR